MIKEYSVSAEIEFDFKTAGIEITDELLEEITARFNEAAERELRKILQDYFENGASVLGPGKGLIK